jgi:hypothetical protein
VPWRSGPSHRLVAIQDVRRLTGQNAQELLRRADTQLLVRIDKDGRREEMVRVPLDLLPEEAEQ